jgi:hypothetical protein
VAVRALVLISAVAFPALGWAEVMDKEFGLPTVIAGGLIGAAAAFVTGRWLPWALTIVAPAIAVFFVMHLSELLDSQVGPAVLREAGPLYVGISWVLPFIVIVALIVGLLSRRGKQNAAT